MTSGKRTPACRRLLSSDADDATDDNHNTAKKFYTQEVERFKGRWNFDPTTGRPVPGNYRWQDCEGQEEKEEEEEEGVENDELKKERRGRFESNRDSACCEGDSRTGGEDLRSTPTSSTRLDSQPVIGSLETDVVDDVKTSPVTSLNAASADPASLTVASRDAAEASADWSKSLASVSAESSPSDVIDQRASSSTSSMTPVNESSSSEIPVTSGTHMEDGKEEEEAGDKRHRQTEIKGYFRCKKLKASKISPKDEEGQEPESRGPISSLGESP